MSTRRTGVRVRGYAEHVDGTRFRFFCPKGHAHIDDVALQGDGLRRRRLPVSKCMDVRLFKSWWSKEKGGVTFLCPQCTKSLKATSTGVEPK